MQLVKEVGEGAAVTCFHSRVERLNDAIQHNFHSLLSAWATSFYFQSLSFFCFAVTFHFTFSFDLFFLSFFIKSLKNCKILSGISRPL